MKWVSFAYQKIIHEMSLNFEVTYMFMISWTLITVHHYTRARGHFWVIESFLYSA